LHHRADFLTGVADNPKRINPVRVAILTTLKGLSSAASDQW